MIGEGARKQGCQAKDKERQLNGLEGKILFPYLFMKKKSFHVLQDPRDLI